MNKRTAIFVFWGCMDLLYVAHHVWVNLAKGRVPIYDDILSFQQVQLSDPGPLALPMFSLGLLTMVSIIVSAWLFLSGSRFARALAYLQVPFRLIFVMPSLLFIPWIVPLAATSNPLFSISLLIICEAIKVGTLLWSKSVQQRQTAPP
ncbi:arginine:ornithine antiporter [Pseudomonas protegens]|uniref:arginine:ornithine antiporter n=1 Tax=Pseudomonas protegens TaxID=380021 RepID=UPI000F4C83BB|nr:arginine:ornithine antiporter [Pseudomonas protegens]